MIAVSCVWGDDAALDYLNHFRQQSGLPAFVSQSNLDQSAQAHSHYMRLNKVSGHYEDSSKDGYTGERPSDRVIAAGYFSRMVGENVAARQSSVEYAIDTLFSAIYHRFGFLDPSNDEIGIGVDDVFYTFDIGNAQKNDLCENGTYNGERHYYINVCKDTKKKISAVDWENAKTTLKAQAGELIVWPPPSGSDVLPAFFEESPDPLPDDSVSGYPVSVEFNDYYFSKAPSVSSFVLTEVASGRELPLITQMDKDNDPNRHFSAYQYALFPKERLEWGAKYAVSLSYDDGDGQQDVNWCFVTRSLKDRAARFYRIENDQEITLNVVSGKRYAIYVVPANTNDVLGSMRVSYTCDSEDFAYIDQNTFVITLQGDKDEYADISFGNNQKIKLVIAESDTANDPATDVCSENDSQDTDGDGLVNMLDTDDDNDGVVDTKDAFALDASESVDTDHDGTGNNADTDDDNDGISDADEIAYGLDPLNASDAHADADGDGFDNALEIGTGTDIRDVASHPRWVLIALPDGANIPLAIK
jgi:hypothetical protein